MPLANMDQNETTSVANFGVPRIPTPYFYG
jgi:hypothetical protein